MKSQIQEKKKAVGTNFVENEFQGFFNLFILKSRLWTPEVDDSDDGDIVTFQSVTNIIIFQNDDRSFVYKSPIFDDSRHHKTPQYIVITNITIMTGLS